MGEYAKAMPYIETALKTNCKNPELLCYAGLIYGKVGDKERAKMYLEEALKNNPVLPTTLKEEMKKLLTHL
jgi:tetratricopeptide (TPR) repeat protein